MYLVFSSGPYPPRFLHMYLYIEYYTVIFKGSVHHFKEIEGCFTIVHHWYSFSFPQDVCIEPV